MGRDENLEDLFPGRKGRLERIHRYHAFDTMHYRTNDWIHSLRVRWIVEDIVPIAKRHMRQFDVRRATALALVHDDAEMVTGDVQAGHKAVMTVQQLARVKENERRAAIQLGKKYPIKVDGKYEYGTLLLESFEKKTAVAQFVSYADKMDAYCESLHEVYSGNLSLLRSVVFYADIFACAEKRFPKIKQILGDRRSPFTDLKRFLHEHSIVASKYAPFGRPFTKKLLGHPSQFPFYDRWRELTIERGGKAAERMLFDQKESIK